LVIGGQSRQIANSAVPILITGGQSWHNPAGADESVTAWVAGRRQEGMQGA